MQLSKSACTARSPLLELRVVVLLGSAVMLTARHTVD
jgi:hypothetical protein